MASLMGATTRIDLHLHSHASGTATNWWVKGLGLGIDVRESYTPPPAAYAMAKRAGMDFVTLTDHETIAGALTLAPHPDLLVGEEVRALFPEDGSAVDLLLYGLDPAAHEESQARRANVYALVDFLREAGIVHALAHPLFALGPPLDRAAVEKRLVLFGLWEVINGARPAAQNRLAREIAGGVDAVDLRRLARRHGLAPPPHRRIAGVAGSDDHAGLFGGTTYTLLPKVGTVADLLAALAAGETEAVGADGSVDRMAETGFRIAGIAAAEGGDARTGDPAAGDATPAATDATRPPATAWGGTGPRFGAATAGWPAAAAAAAPAALRDYLPLLGGLDGGQVRGTLAAQYERRVASALAHGGAGFPVLNLVASLGRFVEGHLFIAPYLAVHGYFGRETQKARALRSTLDLGAGEPSVGVFVDELDGIHGVATLYANLERLAARADGPRMGFVRCVAASGGNGDAAGGDGRATVPAIATLPVPFGEGRALGVPSLLDVVDHVAAADYDLLHVATPGPLGLAALVAGATLGLPVVGGYHTEFGAYAEALSGDAIVAEVVEVLVREFYERCAVVAVPSAATALALRSRGYRIDRFEVLKNGVDTELFGPHRRDEARRQALGGGRTLLVYAGRVSPEKGLRRLAEGYLALRRRRDDVHLVVVGDGPDRRDLADLLAATATFTGFLRGEELARTVAAGDVFVFPSTTDTLGRAVVEAQASGLPAVVYDAGGPAECIRPGVSGFVVAAGDEAGFFARVEDLLDHPGLRTRMGYAAREFAASLDWQQVRDGLIALYRDVAAPPAEATDRAVDPAAALLVPA